MNRPPSHPVVHLELHTGDRFRARSLLAELCGWPGEHVRAARGSYLALDLGAALGGGIVECATERALWLPYVEVSDIAAATERARAQGSSVLLEPREGFAGWRSIVSTGAGGEIAFWQRKR